MMLFSGRLHGNGHLMSNYTDMSKHACFSDLTASVALCVNTRLSTLPHCSECGPAHLSYSAHKAACAMGLHSTGCWRACFLMGKTRAERPEVLRVHKDFASIYCSYHKGDLVTWLEQKQNISEFALK